MESGPIVEEEEEEMPQLIPRRNRPLAMMPFLSGQNPNVRAGAVVDQRGAALRVVPISNMPSRDSEGASISGRSATSASWPLTPEEREWIDVQENEGIMTTAPYSWWVKNDAKYCFAEQLEVFYGIMEEDGYWC